MTMSDFTYGDQRLPERFWSKIGPPDEHGCWPYIAPLMDCGYGRLERGVPLKGKILAHRWAYEALVGPIPEGLVIDHLCRVRHCVNPEHLEPVTMGEDMRRGIAIERARAAQRAKAFCPRGHLYAGENLYVFNGRRRCMECHRLLTQVRKAGRGGHQSPPSKSDTCRHGHPWTPENTYMRPDGAAVCKTCKNEHMRNKKRKAA